MKVLILPGDNGGCGNLRLRWPGQAVADARPDWDVHVTLPRGEIQVGLDKEGRVVEVAIDELPDVMVLQRTGTPIIAGVAEWMMARGVAVVADYDDAMWAIDKSNVAWSAWNMHRTRGKQQHWSWCDYVADRVDLVTVTTEGLARRYGKHGRVEVIPNGVPERALTAPSWRSRYGPSVAVGWAGYTGTHPGDCTVSSAAASAALGAGGALRVVADASGAAREWGLDPSLVDDIPAQDGDNYYSALSTLDVMLVGLRDTPFNNCKSYLKVLEAGAVGVPAIAAATAPHRALAKTGFPVLLASSPAEWEEQVLRLIKDEARLEEARAQVREAMPAHTIENRVEEWVQAWERARKRADGR